MNEELTQIFLFITMVVAAIHIAYIARKYGKEMIHGLKGYNNRWDAPEIFVVIFLPLAVYALFVDLFLDHDVRDSVYIMISGGLGIGSGSRAVMEVGKKKESKPPEDESI